MVFKEYDISGLDLSKSTYTEETREKTQLKTIIFKILLHFKGNGSHLITVKKGL